jgi:hypothetical protein
MQENLGRQATTGEKREWNRPAQGDAGSGENPRAAATAEWLGETPGAVARLRWIIFGSTLFIALFVALFLWRSQSLVSQTLDIYRFADVGRNLAEGRGFRFTGGGLTIRRGPGYPAFIALLYLVFGAKPVVVQLAQCVLAAGTAVLTFEIGRKVFSSVRVGLIAAVAVALHPMLLRYIPDIQVENLLTFLYTLTVYRTVRLVERGSIANGAWVGASAAAAAMVKAVALPYAAAFAVGYLLWRRRSSRGLSGPLPGWRPIAAMCGAMAIIILPWTYRNYEVTGRFVLVSGNAAGEFLRGYVFAQPRYYLLKDEAYVVGENEANDMERALMARQGLVYERDEVEMEQALNVAAREKLRGDPAAFVKKFVIGLFMFWYVVSSRFNSLLVGGCAVAAWALAIVGLLRARGERRPFWLLLLPVLALNLMYAAVLALGRYSAPCIPTLVILAAFGADRLLPKGRGAAAPATTPSAE